MSVELLSETKGLVLTHAEISDASGKVDGSSDPVEDAVGTISPLHDASHDATKSGESHHSTDGIEEVRAVGGDGFIDVFAVLSVGVDIERVVASCDSGSESEDGNEFGEHVWLGGSSGC